MRVLNLIYSTNRPNWQNKANVRREYPKYSNPISFGAKLPKYGVLVQRIIYMLSDGANNLPEGLSNVKRASDGTILSFNKLLQNENRVFVSKHLTDRLSGRSSYFIVKEQGPNAFKDFIGVDFQKGNIIELSRETKLPISVRGRFKDVPLTDDRHAIYESKLEQFFREILNITEEEPAIANTVSPKAPVIPPTKEQPAPQPINTQKFKPQPQVTEHKPQPIQKSVEVIPQAAKSAGLLSSETQKDIIAIKDLLIELNNLEQSTYSSFAAKFKQNYESLLNRNHSIGYIFKYGNNETLQIQRVKRSNDKLLKFIHTDSDGKTTTYLVEDFNKIVSNYKGVSNIPVERSYYTEEQLQNLPIKEYVKFIKEGLEKYSTDIEDEFLQKQASRVSKKSSAVAEPETSKITEQPEKVEKVENPEPLTPKAQEIEDAGAETHKEPEIKGTGAGTSRAQRLEGLNFGPIGQKLDLSLTIEEVDKMAEDNARLMAQRYMETFTSNFYKLVEEKITLFKNGLSDLLSKFNQQ